MIALSKLNTTTSNSYFSFAKIIVELDRTKKFESDPIGKMWYSLSVTSLVFVTVLFGTVCIYPLSLFHTLLALLQQTMRTYFRSRIMTSVYCIKVVDRYVESVCILV